MNNKPDHPEITRPTEAELDEMLGKPGPPIEVDPEQLAAAVALQRAEAKSQTTDTQEADDGRERRPDRNVGSV